MKTNRSSHAEEPLVDAYAFCHTPAPLPRHHSLLEDPSPVFVVFKLVEAGAGRRQQNHISRHRLAAAACSTAASSVPAGTTWRDPPDLPFDLFRRRADGVDRFDPLLQQSMELGVVGVLIFAAENEVNVPRKGGNCFCRGVDVGGLGVVVVVDALDGGNKLQPMLNGMEGRDRPGNGLGRQIRHCTPRKQPRAHSRHCARP